MKVLPWLLAISTLILVMIEAVAFHKATVCRQEAWLKATELRTRTLLGHSNHSQRDFHYGCRIILVGQKESITWQRLPGFKKYSFDLPLKGHL